VRSIMVTPDTLIAAMRIGLNNASITFKSGKCFQLHRVLKCLYPDATCWYDAAVGHVYTEICGMYYDIDGAHEKLPPNSEQFNFSVAPMAYAKAHDWDV
jgi:hypothetical protein